MTRSASPPLVMKVFCPLTTSSLPLRSAVVRIACRSLPVPGSVMAMAVIDLALGHARQPGALLLLAAVVEDVGRDDIGVQAEAGRGVDALGHLLDHDGAVEEVGAAAAVLLGHVGEQQPRLAGLAPHLAADLALLLPALVVGRDLAIDEGVDGLAEELVLVLVDAAGQARAPWLALRCAGAKVANAAPQRHMQPTSSRDGARYAEAPAAAGPDRAGCTTCGMGPVLGHGALRRRP